MNVLFVEDDPIFTLLVQRAARLLQRGNQLLTCRTLSEAEQRCQEAQFWVIDVHLVDGMGHEWLLRQRLRGENSPALLWSHGSLDADLAPLQPCWFQEKPRDLEGLRNRMNAWWNQ